MSRARYFELLNHVSDIAILAGKAVLELYDKDYGMEFKEDFSPLTQADKNAHTIIIRALKKLDANTPVISEEGFDECDEQIAINRYWLVDPLDGTKEFINRNGEFTVNIALIEFNRPVLGVVYAPAIGFIYKACKGFGAYKKDLRQDNFQRIHVANKMHHFNVVGSRSHSSSEMNTFVSKINCERILNVGSSLKFCMVAEGVADLYPRFGPTSHWDTAAAQCIVEESGGSVTDFQGHPLEYPFSSNKLNPFFVGSGVSKSFDLISVLKTINSKIL